MVLVQMVRCYISSGWYELFTNWRGRVGGFVVDEKGIFKISATEYRDPIEKLRFATFKEMCKYLLENKHEVSLGTNRLKRIVKLGAAGRVAFKLDLYGPIYWPGPKPEKYIKVDSIIRGSKAFIDLFA